MSLQQVIKDLDETLEELGLANKPNFDDEPMSWEELKKFHPSNDDELDLFLAAVANNQVH